MSATTQSTLSFALMRDTLTPTFSAISQRLATIFGSYETLGDLYLRRCANLLLLRRFSTSIRRFYDRNRCRTPSISPFPPFPRTAEHVAWAGITYT